MKGILMIGPREWGDDHYKHLEKRDTTAIQYSAHNFTDAQTRLSLLPKPFPLFIYTPKNYQNLPNGSQTIEFACRVIDYKLSYVPMKSPWPTIPGPKWYDKKKDFKYEFWFNVDLIQKCNLKATDFVFHRSNGSNVTYETVAKFIGPARGKILFASYDYKFNNDKLSDISKSNLFTEEITHGDIRSVLDEEGRRRIIQHISYERSSKNREMAIEIHGTTCKICKFNFDSFYGSDLAKQYIEVHHIIPLYKKQRKVNPEKDLICVCSNCHSMLHRRADDLVSIEELKSRIKRNSE